MRGDSSANTDLESWNSVSSFDIDVVGEVIDCRVGFVGVFMVDDTGLCLDRDLSFSCKDNSRVVLIRINFILEASCIR